MNDETLGAQLPSAEGLRLAFFRERFKIAELAETLVAFANGAGGVAVVGVSGRVRGRVEGVADTDAAREAALEAALSCTPPMILPLPELRRHGDATMMLVSVPPGLPHVYNLHGKYLRREGATNQPLPPDALRRLLTDRGEVSWERLVPVNASLADLDDDKIEAYARRIGPPAEDGPYAFLFRRGCLQNAERRAQNVEQLRPPLATNGQQTEQSSNDVELRDTVDSRSPLSALRSTADSRSPFVPTNAGLLLFARNVERHFPQAEITLVQYRGRDLADEFEREDVHDTLPEAVRRAERWLGEHMRKGSRMVGLERQDWTQFPLAAVRETLVNAVAHRDYSVRGEGIRIALFADRLECYSPGRLPGHVTIDNLVEERFSRNETLVQVLADFGLIERLGYGIDRMLRQMAEAGLPPPQFRETAAGFMVALVGQDVALNTAETVDTRAWLAQGLNERQIAALLHLSQHQRITNRDLQDLAPDVSPETLRRDMVDLVDRGLLLKVGEKRATYYILK